MAAEMNDVSMTMEVTSVKTTLTQRRSRVNPVGRVVILVQQMARNTKDENRNEHRELGQTHRSEIDQKDQETAKLRDENETNKVKIETKKGSEQLCFTVTKHSHGGKAQGQVSTKASLCWITS